MQLFIDSADLSEIRAIMDYGVCSGCTTNPSLIKKAVDGLKAKGENIDMIGYIKSICCALGAGRPVSLEVVGLSADEMIREAKKLRSLFSSVANNVVIKIPINTSMGAGSNCEGLKAITALEKMGIKTNATLIMSPEQALLAARAGASYVSPFAGRTDDLLRAKVGLGGGKTDYFPAEGVVKDGVLVEDKGVCSGVDLVKKIVDIFDVFGLKTEVIAASLRNTRQVREAAEVGADIATIPFGVIENMLKHPKTAEGVVKFSEDVVPEYGALFG